MREKWWNETVTAKYKKKLAPSSKEWKSCKSGTVPPATMKPGPQCQWFRKTLWSFFPVEVWFQLTEMEEKSITSRVPGKSTDSY